VVWDIGANKGTFTYQLIDQFPSVRVVAIEPQPDLADMIRANLEDLHYGLYEVFDVAIGSDETEMTLVMPGGNRGAATLAPEGEPFENSTQMVVRIVPAEWVLERSQFGWPTIIKLDVEGYESVVIRSMRSAFRAGIPRAVVFEHRGGTDERWTQISDDLTGAGYLLFAIRRSVWRTWLEPVSAATEHRLPQRVWGDRTTDYVAVRGDLVKSLSHNRIGIPSRSKQRVPGC
jgi:FkbM family methyltransferase